MNNNGNDPRRAKLAAAIRAHRESCGHTREQFAVFTGVSKETIRALEKPDGAPRRQWPNLDTLLRIAAALKFRLRNGVDYAPAFDLGYSIQTITPYGGTPGIRHLTMRTYWNDVRVMIIVQEWAA